MNNLDKLKLEKKTTLLEIRYSQARLSQKTSSIFSVKNVVSEIISSVSKTKSEPSSEEGVGKSLFKGVLAFVFKKIVERF